MLVVNNPNSLFKFRHRIDTDIVVGGAPSVIDVSTETKRFSSPE
jgi:hypothetical protein